VASFSRSQARKPPIRAVIVADVRTGSGAQNELI
jgi:hypothetical protein